MVYNAWLVYSLGDLATLEDDSRTHFSVFVYLGNNRELTVVVYLIALYLVGPFFSRPLLTKNLGVKFLNGLYD